MNTPLRLTAVAALLAVATGASALETELQHGGFVVGDGGSSKPGWFLFNSGFASKAMDQGWVLHDDAAAQVGATGRLYGFGVTLGTVFAVGQDRSASYPVNRPDPSSTAEASSFLAAENAARLAGEPYSDNLYNTRENKPGELLQFGMKLDWLFQINGVYGDNGPFLQIIPHLDWNTYPNQSSNPYAPGITPTRTTKNPAKDDQRWLGLDLWWATPIPGIEFGTGHDFNVARPGYRGAAGFREFLQAAPVDFQFWQLLNWGNGEYHKYFLGTDHRGLTYSQIGAKAIVPMPWSSAWWGYAKADWTYWIANEDRKMLEALDRDAGDLVFAVGLEYRAQ